MEGLRGRKRLPKLFACMTKKSLENLRNKALFSLDVANAKELRRYKLPLHKCLIKELQEAGYAESSNYLRDLIYDNLQLLIEDDIGIVVDLRKREDYLEHICAYIQKAENFKSKGETKMECLQLLHLAMDFAEKEKGILWLAEKFYLASIAVSSQYLLDGGRQNACCKYHYANFLLDKFPGGDPDESFVILTQVRDSAIGKTWLLYEPSENGEEVPSDTIFAAAACELHRVLLTQARAIRKVDPGKAERLSRLAERRAIETNMRKKIAEAITEIGISQLAMNTLTNAQNTLDRAYKIQLDSNNIEGLCETKMHLAAVIQRLGKHEESAKLLTEMGALAIEHDLRWQLGQALHLLGELHLWRERPELGTQHLTEAFFCFMGMTSHSPKSLSPEDEVYDSDGGFIYQKRQKELYREDAEQSRLMMAISAGQENMASYFSILKEARYCSIAKMRIIEWKLHRAGWWVKRHHHDFLPCRCPAHNKTPLDVLRMKLNLLAESTEFEVLLKCTTENMRIS